MPTDIRPRRPVYGLLLATEFLTVLPMRRSRADEGGAAEGPPDMATALPWFPVVGALLGLAMVALDWVLSLVFPLGIRAVALLAFDALATGMLHLDGFVDCCDALLGTRSVSRRLEILRDSRVGAYGALGGALLLIARFAALNALAGGPVRILALLTAPTLGRWGMVFAVTRFPYLRAAGAGSPFQTRRNAHLLLATAPTLLILFVNAIVVAGDGIATNAVLVLTVLLLLAALTVLIGWLAWASRRLGGGLTGDTYGAACVLVELAVLLLAPPLALVATHVML